MKKYKGIANYKGLQRDTLHTKYYEAPQLAREAILKRIKKEGWGLENSDVHIIASERKVIEEKVLILKSKLDQLEADAELGRAVRKAFEQGKVLYSYAEIGNYFLMDTEQDLLEWAKEVGL